MNENDIRLDELSKIMSGVNNASWIRTPAGGARDLNIWDVLFYIHNRHRELNGLEPHTPEEWYETER